MTLLLVVLAGGVGAVCRMLLDAAVTRRVVTRLPLGILVVNIAGSLLLGLLVGWAATRPSSMSTQVRAVLGTGFCGGFTTFSTASVEAVRLWVTDGPRRGAIYASATFLGSVAAAMVGMLAGTALAG